MAVGPKEELKDMAVDVKGELELKGVTCRGGALGSKGGKLGIREGLS